MLFCQFHTYTQEFSPFFKKILFENRFLVLEKYNKYKNVCGFVFFMRKPEHKSEYHIFQTEMKK